MTNPVPDATAGRRGARWVATLRRQGITPAQFVFQFLIVAVGVWLAIVVGARTEEAQQRTRASATLRSVLEELEQDESEIIEVLASQRRNEATVRRVATVIREPAPEDTLVYRLIARDFESNRTFFPRRAAYSILVSGAHLEDITDPQLRLALANLYDHDYVRMANAGRLSDEIMFGFRNTSLEIWDYEKNRLIADPEAARRMSNICHRIVIFKAFYTRILEQQLSTIRELQTAIRAYLA